jgi:predicted secreted hydrolase
MRNKLNFIGFCALVLAVAFHPIAAQFREAMPGYKYEFPRDYFNHPDFQTEWWYYTGNLKSADGRAFGFELTFFRIGASRVNAQRSDWAVNDVYMAHLALSDIEGQHFYHHERLNRAGPGLAGVNADSGRVWNGNWQIQLDGGTQRLRAVSDDFSLDFKLLAMKPPVIHGIDGVSQKSAGAGRASHYISLTRLAVSGAIDLNGVSIPIDGTAWMDHEFFTQQLDSNQTGWDWLSLQLDDNTELMLFRIRRKDGSIDPYSSGTYIDTAGKTTHLERKDFDLEPTGEMWTSTVSKAAYPIHWRVSVPPLHLQLDVRTPLKQQEISGNIRYAPSYWEGAIRLRGERSSAPIAGAGYLEMTGYDKPYSLASDTRP